MREKGFVYEGELEGDELKSLLERLGKIVGFVWTLKSFEIVQSIPDDLGDEGTAFNSKCEVKWKQTKSKRFRFLVLSDEPLNDLSLAEVNGDWTVEEETTNLLSLNEKRIAPQFNLYPVVNDVKAKLLCKVFYCNGVAMFVSPREVKADERAAS